VQTPGKTPGKAGVTEREYADRPFAATVRKHLLLR
jgi:hypothetical protein